MIFSSFKEINMDWNNLVGNFNDFALSGNSFQIIV
jgi:hypothetical protein